MKRVLSAFTFIALLFGVCSISVYAEETMEEPEVVNDVPTTETDQPTEEVDEENAEEEVEEEKDLADEQDEDLAILSVQEQPEIEEVFLTPKNPDYVDPRTKTDTYPIEVESEKEDLESGVQKVYQSVGLTENQVKNYLIAQVVWGDGLKSSGLIPSRLKVVYEGLDTIGTYETDATKDWMALFLDVPRIDATIDGVPYLRFILEGTSFPIYTEKEIETNPTLKKERNASLMRQVGQLADGYVVLYVERIETIEQDPWTDLGAMMGFQIGQPIAAVIFALDLSSLVDAYQIDYSFTVEQAPVITVEQRESVQTATQQSLVPFFTLMMTSLLGLTVVVKMND